MNRLRVVLSGIVLALLLGGITSCATKYPKKRKGKACDCPKFGIEYRITGCHLLG